MRQFFSFLLALILVTFATIGDVSAVTFIKKSDQGKTNIQVEDNPNVDAFSRLRTGEPFGIFDNKNIHSRHSTLWEERIAGAVIAHGSVTGSGFTVGQTFTGGTSGIAGTITAVGSGTITYDVDHNDIEDGETITNSSGGTATVTTHDTGSHISHLPNESSVQLQVGTSSGDYAIRQTHRYFPYVPGKSQLILQTFVFGTGTGNIVKRAGYFDDNDGIYIEQNGSGTTVAIRSSASGSVAEDRFAQSDWNLDDMDGDGIGNPSGINLDDTKAAIGVMDMQWLGVGRVRVGFSIGGRIHYVHEFNHANTSDRVYMSTPTLPVRFEIRNTGGISVVQTMKEICSSIVSEGGFELPGLEFTVSRGLQEAAITARTPILLLRLKDAIGTKNNRRSLKFLNAGFSARTNDALFEIHHMHDPSGITGGAWVDVAGGSGAEYNTGSTALTGTPSHLIEQQFVFSGQANKGTSSTLSAEFTNQHSFISQNFESDNSQIFGIFATPRTGTSDVLAHITFIESE